MPITQAGDIELYFEIHGDGPPVLLISGLGGDHGAWEACLPALMRYRAIVFDNRGAGRSSSPPGPWSTALMAADTARVMDAAGVPSAHVAGLSMGGAIAQELAISYPDRVLSLTLASTWAKPDGHLHRLMRSWADAASRCGMTPLWEQLLLLSFSPRLFDEGGDRLDVMLAGAPQDPADIDAFVKQAKACIEHDAVDRLHRIDAPTLILVGDTDIYTPVRYARRLHELVPGSSLIRLTDSAHAFPIEEPDVFTSRLIGFVESVPGVTHIGGTHDG